MSKYIITGQERLFGKVKISGNKNSILPCLAASLLTDQEVILRNVPHIRDVAVFIQIFKTLGINVEFGDHFLKIQAKKINKPKLEKELVTKLRASILLAGSLLSRCGKAEFFHPGGDIIGKRSIDTHLQGLQELGYKVRESDLSFDVSGKVSAREGKIIFLEEASVSAMENLLLACSNSTNLIVFKNCPEEPHVIDLCRMLVAMGVEIRGIGTSTLYVRGTRSLKGVDFTISSDHIEFGTYAIASAITDGEIEISGCSFEDLYPIIAALKKMGVEFEKINDQIVKVSRKNLVATTNLKVNIWPGFPTDMMSLAIVLATQAKGVSICHDWMYETRMFFVDKLITMGAEIIIADPHRVIISGPSNLFGRELDTPDVRAGMALVLAGLASSGQSIIHKAELIERGYEDVVEKLTSLGAKIDKIDES